MNPKGCDTNYNNIKCYNLKLKYYIHWPYVLKLVNNFLLA